jgi:hypothetical protein
MRQKVLSYKPPINKELKEERTETKIAFLNPVKLNRRKSEISTSSSVKTAAEMYRALKTLDS